MSYKVSFELDQLLEALVGREKQLIYEQIDKPLPHTIRFNPLKGTIAALQDLLIEQGFRFESVEGFNNAFRIIYQPYPIGKSLSHYLGHIYVQDIASMLPPLVLDPQPGEWLLDMSAAPGSKTTQIATLMENRGVIFANDIVMKRIRSLASNLERLGVVNTAVFKLFGEQIGNQYFENFHRVLLDPACTGLGTLHKSPEVLSWWTPHHCERMASGQKGLIASAIKALRPEGVLCYSTCTLTPEENEEVIDYALKEFPVELEAFSIPGLKSRNGLTAFQNKTYHPSLEKACRVYPFQNETEGFFIAKLRKTATMKKDIPKKSGNRVRVPFLSSKTSPVKKYLDFLADHFQIPAEAFSEFTYLMRQNIIFCDAELLNFPFYHRPVQCGLGAGRQMTHGAKLTTGGVHLLGYHARQNVFEISGLEELGKFVNREATGIKLEGKGQVILKYKDCPIGYGLADSGILKSQFPKGNWPFKLLTEAK
jgi:NOL1/NOP2/sun family putative RNA methylase